MVSHNLAVRYIKVADRTFPRYDRLNPAGFIKRHKPRGVVYRGNEIESVFVACAQTRLAVSAVARDIGAYAAVVGAV